MRSSQEKRRAGAGAGTGTGTAAAAAAAKPRLSFMEITWRSLKLRRELPEKPQGGGSIQRRDGEARRRACGRADGLPFPCQSAGEETRRSGGLPRRGAARALRLEGASQAPCSSCDHFPLKERVNFLTAAPPGFGDWREPGNARIQPSSAPAPP